MSYDVLEKTYETLTEEQQLIVYNLAVSLGNMNINRSRNDHVLNKRTFGKFAGKATATFSDNWEMTEEELCSL